jgi:hypothetical protein
MSEIHACASATIMITVEVTSRGHWGANATIEEVRRQGGQEALKELKDALRTIDARVIGEPKISIVTWEPER